MGQSRWGVQGEGRSADTNLPPSPFRWGGVHLGQRGPWAAGPEGGGLGRPQGRAARREPPLHRLLGGLLPWQHSAGRET